MGLFLKIHCCSLTVSDHFACYSSDTCDFSKCEIEFWVEELCVDIERQKDANRTIEELFLKHFFNVSVTDFEEQTHHF